MQEAKAKVEQQNELLTQQTQRANETQAELSSQGEAIVVLQGNIQKSHDNEVALAKYNAYAKPIIEQVNKYWGIGAFFYGFKVLGRHLFILAIVLVSIALILVVLSFIFPALGAFLRAAGAVIAAIFRRIGDIFRRK